MNIMKKAFTLTELLISMAVIGVVCAILVPIVFNIMPNQNALMAKRAFYTAQSIVSELLNDEACYPDKTKGSAGINRATTVRRVGFDDGFGYSGCEKWGGSTATSNTITTEGSPNEKFVRLFANLMNRSSDTIGSKKEDENNSDKITSYNFTTKDGIDWEINVKESGFDDWLNTAEDADPEDSYVYIIADVNGAAKDPNCGESAPTKACSSVENYDKFAMKLYVNGKIDILDAWANDAVDVNKDVTNE